jgi:hypothetical protein
MDVLQRRRGSFEVFRVFQPSHLCLQLLFFSLLRRLSQSHMQVIERALLPKIICRIV